MTKSKKTTKILKSLSLCAKSAPLCFNKTFALEFVEAVNLNEPIQILFDINKKCMKYKWNFLSF